MKSSAKSTGCDDSRRKPPPNKRATRLVGSRLFISDDGETTEYKVQRLTPDPIVASAAVRLTRVGSPVEVYDVAVTEFGLECSCADWIFKRSNEKHGCKHCVCCVTVGLLRGK